MTTVLHQPNTVYHYNGAGQLHRLDGPAISIRNTFKEWWVDGKLHRLKGPAVIHPNGVQYWMNGKRHRIDGPAFKYNNSEQWWINDELHREDGPALINFQFEAYYLNNKYYTKENYYKELERRKKLSSKYFRKWLFNCDQPGKRLYQIFLEKNYNDLEKLLNN